AVLAACIAAFAVTVLLMRRSILTERVARRGHHVTREYATDPFLNTRVEAIMATPAHALAASIPVREAVEFFANVEGPRRHKSYPVVDEAQRVVGLVSRSDALRWTRSGWEKNATLGDIEPERPLIVGHPDELVGHLCDRMAAADVGRIPIVDRAGHRQNIVERHGKVRRRDLHHGTADHRGASLGAVGPAEFDGHRFQRLER